MSLYFTSKVPTSGPTSGSNYNDSLRLKSRGLQKKSDQMSVKKLLGT